MYYSYDNTFDGFLSAVFDIYVKKHTEVTIMSEAELPVPTLYEVLHVETGEDKVQRIINGLNAIHPLLYERIYLAWHTREAYIDNALFAAIKEGFRLGTNPLARVFDQDIKHVVLAAKRAAYDVERAYQFVRFIKINGVLYGADYEPQYNILHLVGRHFNERFGSHNFFIRDKKHGVVLLSRPGGYIISVLTAEQAALPLVGQDEYADMWRNYFKVLANPQRKNTKLQQHFVPLKYRKNMTEFTANPAASG